MSTSIFTKNDNSQIFNEEGKRNHSQVSTFGITKCSFYLIGDFDCPEIFASEADIIWSISIELS